MFQSVLVSRRLSPVAKELHRRHCLVWVSLSRGQLILKVTDWL